MPVFLTGGTGFIGPSTVRALRADAHEVRVLARSDEAEAKVRKLGAEPIRGHLSDLDVLRGEASRADAIIALAQDQTPDGVEIARAALEAMLDAMPHGGTFIYTSGVWVYGSRGDAVVDEDAPLHPLPIVAWRPAHEELALAHQGRLRVIVIRPAVVYGDGGGIPGIMVEAARNGQLRIVGDGTNRWPTVRHDALAELFALAVNRRNARGIYNASRGASVPYEEIAHAASRAAGGDGAVERVSLEDGRRAMGPFADALAIDLQVDSSRATRDLGWEPHRPTLLEELSNTSIV